MKFITYGRPADSLKSKLSNNLLREGKKNEPSLRIPRGSTIADAPVVKWSFNNPRAGLIWLVPRLWLGYRWIDAAVHKVSNPTWVNGGAGPEGFLEERYRHPGGRKAANLL